MSTIFLEIFFKVSDRRLCFYFISIKLLCWLLWLCPDRRFIVLTLRVGSSMGNRVGLERRQEEEKMIQAGVTVGNDAGSAVVEAGTPVHRWGGKWGKRDGMGLVDTQNCFWGYCYQKLGSPHDGCWPNRHNWTKREGGRAQLLKEWHSPRTQHKVVYNSGQWQIGPRWETSQLPLNLEPQYTLVTHWNAPVC